MEKVNIESVKKALSIFLKLIEKSGISKGDYPELFEALEDGETDHILQLIAEEADILIIRTGDSIFFSPGIENSLFGYKNEELRKEMRLENNTELYTAYVIMLGILIKFYNGENFNNKCRTILKTKELEQYITSKMTAFTQDANPEKRDEDLCFNFTAVADYWLGLPVYDEKITRLSSSKGTRVSLISKVLNFLKVQELVNVDNDNEIFTTARLDALVAGYYPESSRKKEILSYIERVRETRTDQEGFLITQKNEHVNM
jgi:hypothetical protein